MHVRKTVSRAANRTHRSVVTQNLPKRRSGGENAVGTLDSEPPVSAAKKPSGCAGLPFRSLSQLLNKWRDQCMEVGGLLVKKN